MCKHVKGLSCFSFCVLLMVAFTIGSSPIFGQVGTQVPLAPTAIPQFVDRLPHFAGLRVDATTATDVWVKAVASKQVAVSTGTVLGNGDIVGTTPGAGLANVWVYQISTTSATSGFTPPLWPAFTIETVRGHALNVHYSNQLGGQKYSDVGLLVDWTLHAADPLMQQNYDGEPPITVHLHGGEVPPTSDGGPDSWFLPGENADHGHAFNPNAYYYPNTQEAATLWFHDHALGGTRLNVYAGMAGFYFLRDPNEDALALPGFSGDNLVQQNDRVTGLPMGEAYLPEIEIAIQDRMFDMDGQLYFPSMPPNPTVHPYWTPEFVGDIITVNGKTWPYLSVAPRRYRFRFLNGSNARFYELWLQDLASGQMGPVIHQIGTDGGFLDNSVAIDPALGQKLIMGPGERADVVIDFSAVPGAVWTLRNSGRAPYPKGGPPMGNSVGRIMQFVVNGSTVGDNSAAPPYALKTNVKLTNFAGAPNPDIPAVAKTRQLTLNEVMGAGGPLEVLVNNTKWSGLSEGTNVRSDFTEVPNSDGSKTYYSETMDEGTTEIWQIINITADAHPIHLHLVQFQLMSRQNFNLNKYTKAYNAAFSGGAFIGAYGPPKQYDYYATAPNIPAAGPIYGGNPDVRPYLQGPMKPANPNERGWKDTFIMYPGEVTTVIARWAPTDKAANLDPDLEASGLWFPFDPNGGHGYVWHCHIIDHEDNEMMRPYNVNPSQFNPNVITAAPIIVLGEPGENTNPESTELPFSFELSQNYPNPFNPTTEIRFSLPEANHVSLKVYNVMGQEVTTLINADAPAGYHTVRLDARDLASGLYIYKIEAGNFVQSKKMVLMK